MVPVEPRGYDAADRGHEVFKVRAFWGGNRFNCEIKFKSQSYRVESIHQDSSLKPAILSTKH